MLGWVGLVLVGVAWAVPLHLLTANTANVEPTPLILRVEISSHDRDKPRCRNREGQWFFKAMGKLKSGTTNEYTEIKSIIALRDIPTSHTSWSQFARHENSKRLGFQSALAWHEWLGCKSARQIKLSFAPIAATTGDCLLAVDAADAQNEFTKTFKQVTKGSAPFTWPVPKAVTFGHDDVDYFMPIPAGKYKVDLKGAYLWEGEEASVRHKMFVCAAADDIHAEPCLKSEGDVKAFPEDFVTTVVPRTCAENHYVTTVTVSEVNQQSEAKTCRPCPSGETNPAGDSVLGPVTKCLTDKAVTHWFENAQRTMIGPDPETISGQKSDQECIAACKTKKGHKSFWLLTKTAGSQTKGVCKCFALAIATAETPVPGAERSSGGYTNVGLLDRNKHLMGKLRHLGRSVQTHITKGEQVFHPDISDVKARWTRIQSADTPDLLTWFTRTREMDRELGKVGATGLIQALTNAKEIGNLNAVQRRILGLLALDHMLCTTPSSVKSPELKTLQKWVQTELPKVPGELTTLAKIGLGISAIVYLPHITLATVGSLFSDAYDAVANPDRQGPSAMQELSVTGEELADLARKGALKSTCPPISLDGAPEPRMGVPALDAQSPPDSTGRWLTFLDKLEHGLPTNPKTIAELTKAFSLMDGVMGGDLIAQKDTEAAIRDKKAKLVSNGLALVGATTGAVGAVAASAVTLAGTAAGSLIKHQEAKGQRGRKAFFAFTKQLLEPYESHKRIAASLAPKIESWEDPKVKKASAEYKLAKKLFGAIELRMRARRLREAIEWLLDSQAASFRSLAEGTSATENRQALYFSGVGAMLVLDDPRELVSLLKDRVVGPTVVTRTLLSEVLASNEYIRTFKDIWLRYLQRQKAFTKVSANGYLDMAASAVSTTTDIYGMVGDYQTAMEEDADTEET